MCIKLVILGLLMEGPKHPYEIQQIVKERGMDCYIKFAKGSLYYAFEKLQGQDLIEVAEVIRDTNRPEKTIYRITEKGKEQFQQLLTEQARERIQVTNPLHAALAFFKYGNTDELLQVLEAKSAETERSLSAMQALYDNKAGVIDRASLYIIKGVMEHLKTELKWLNDIKEDAKQGRLNQL